MPDLHSLASFAHLPVSVQIATEATGDLPVSQFLAVHSGHAFQERFNWRGVVNARIEDCVKKNQKA